MTFYKDYVFVPQEAEHETHNGNECSSEQEALRLAMVKHAQQQGGC
ncbi:hypothetical protein [Vibrio sp. ABG19]|nr:hypothetical protein [Vibrio sp. ABG19]WGY44763.1 hypothetical protein J0X00_03355 [Vibrio sp. ABG19]